MRPEIEVTLAGRNGNRIATVKPRGGFPTRHIRTRQPIATPKPKPKTEPVNLHALLVEVDRLLNR